MRRLKLEQAADGTPEMPGVYVVTSPYRQSSPVYCTTREGAELWAEQLSGWHEYFDHVNAEVHRNGVLVYVHNRKEARL